MIQEVLCSFAFRVGEHFLRCTHLDYLSFIHEHDLVCCSSCKSHFMGYKKHCHAIFCQGEHYVQNLFDHLWIKGRSRFIKEHGFTEVAPVDIMDSEGVEHLPVVGGKHLKEDIVGAHVKNYDFMMVLTHFKGHPMGGFGGALKNIAIGVASSAGKANIHSSGIMQDPDAWHGYEGGRFMKLTGPDHDGFIESMAEAAKAVSDFFGQGEKMLYISVMNNMSVDCDCVAHPADVDMKDIGVLASLNPVALDQACVDLVYEAPDGHSLIERIQSRNGELILKHAEEIGLGDRRYRLVCVD